MTAAAAYTCVLSTYTRIFLAKVVGIRIILAGIRRIPAYTLDYTTGRDLDKWQRQTSGNRVHVLLEVLVEILKDQVELAIAVHYVQQPVIQANKLTL